MTLLLAFVGCTPRDFSDPVYDDTDGKVTFRVGLDIADAQPLATRTILDGVPEQPAGQYLKEALRYYLFVFEDNGSPQTNFLRELVYGNDIRDLKLSNDHDHPAVNPGKPLLTFTVRLDGTAENAIIHIVATSDPDFEKQLEFVPDRSEFGIFTGANGLYTSKKEAYWRRIVLDRPITADDEDKRAIQTQLSHVNMVRNFSRVTLNISDATEDVMGFVPEAFVVVNAIDLGYVAAYNENLGDDNKPGFVDFEAKAETEPYGYLGVQRTYRDLTDTEKYVPSRHPASNRQYADDNISWTVDFERTSGDDNPESNMLPKYMFERAVQSDHKTFVVVKGCFPGQASTYIKLDIGTIDPNTIDAETGEPFGVFETCNLIRNFSYDITITHIRSKDVGHASVESALGAPPANNISTSIETRPLTTIYDGVDKMEVNQTTIVIVDQDGPDGNPLPNPKSFTMMWRYENDYYKELNPRIYSSESVKWNFPGYALAFDESGNDPDGIIASWVGSGGSPSTATPVNRYTAANPTARNDSQIYSDNWRGFELNFLTPGDVTREKTIRLYQPNGLTRDVTFISHKRWEFVDRRPVLDNWNVEVFPGSYSYENNTMPYESLDEMRAAFEGYSDYQDSDFSQVGSQRGAQMTLVFELPVDLPEAIFPLDFKIGADRQNIENAHVGNAVVTWGTSLFENDPDPVGVLRMQFIKTVTWDYYQKHKLVCVRFLTTTDVLNDADDNYSGGQVQPDDKGNVIAQTRIRVTNPYFKPGNDRFERSSHQDVIDPTRTRWHWNFNYPEWSVYFSPDTGGYADCTSDPTGWPDTMVENKESNPHNLNNLSFSGYTHGTQDDYTNVSGTFMQPKADMSGVHRSADNPEFQFDLDASSKTGMTATMVIQATPNRDRDYRGPTYKYDFYYRTVYVKLITQDHPEGIVRFQNCDGREGSKEGIYNRYRLEMRTLTYNFDIAANDVVKKVLIWSEMRTGSQPSGLGTYTYKEGETRYYDILFTLTPND